MITKIDKKSGNAGSHLLGHVDDYLAIGQQAGASDIHLGVNAPPIWRLHGTLQPIWPDAPCLMPSDTKRLADGFLNDLRQTFRVRWHEARRIGPDRLEGSM